ncbi:MAG: transcription antitermination factor NusB [Bacteroidota bacterium]
MISRRIIRVKVMQSIYAIRSSNHPEFTTGDAEKILKKQFGLTLSLFTYQVWFLTEVARYAEIDARNRGSKHLPTKEDLSVPVKIAGNELLWRILESEVYKDATAIYKPQLLDSEDWVRQVYNKLVASTEYAVYNTTEGREKKNEREILEFIFNDLMLANEDFVSFIEDHFNNWDDDADMLRMLILQYLQKPGILQFKEMISKEKFDFGKELLDVVENRIELLDEWIKPKLRNWDAERLALLDMILLQMGVAEFLYFETIPPKVTINEYIDLAKAYSTPQSGQFINGILDSVRKELENQQRLNKVAFKK